LRAEVVMVCGLVGPIAHRRDGDRSVYSIAKIMTAKGKLIALPFCPLRIPHGLPWD
jgi:hypothetical protein